MRTRVGLLVAGVLLIAPAALFAVEPPVAVSPGSPTGTVIGDTCPTFSWGAVAGTRFSELVVYGLGEDGEEPREVLRQRITGSASSWTPALQSCLHRASQYAWSVRAVGGEDSGEWSAPNLFEVAAGPSEAEFEAAVEVVRSYLQVADEASSSGDAVTEAKAAPESEAEPGTEVSAPDPEVVGTTQLTVEGGVVATSFTGDGSTVTHLDPANLSSGTAGIDISGNAATATTAAAASDLTCTDAMGRGVAAELVGNETPGLASVRRQQPVEEALRRQAITSRLEENVDRVAVLVSSSPEVLPLSADGDEELVQVPGVVQAAPSPSEA